MPKGKPGHGSYVRSDPSRCLSLQHEWVLGSKKCQKCANEGTRRWRLRNPAERAEAKALVTRCPQCHVNQKARYPSGLGSLCRECFRLRHLNSVCACGRPKTGISRGCGRCQGRGMPHSLCQRPTKPGCSSANCVDCKRVRRLAISASDYWEWIERFNGKCEICASELAVPYLDHCHSTGKVRGILCNACNTGIGFFKDNTETLRAAAAYLDGSRLKI